MIDPREAIRRDLWGAHEAIFAHWHEDGSPEFHKRLVLSDYWGPEPRRVILGFRGCAKSTRAEEFATLAAVDPESPFHSILFVGPSEARAADHVISIGHELKTNDILIQIYGPQLAIDRLDGTPVIASQTRLLLKNTRSIMAMGRGQDIRGLKQLGHRPDLIIVDDFEDKENVLTPEGRRAMLRWFLRELRPACHPRNKMRVLSTVMHPECVPLLLVRDAGWPVSRYPITYVGDDSGERCSWPSRFPLEWVGREREEYRRLGDAEGWELEMMCDESAAVETRDFKPEHFRVVPRERTWQATYAMYDPARTVGRKSATTGKAVWSWMGRKLVVWRLEAQRWLPDDLLRDVFLTAEAFDPTWIGIEEDSLNEWLRQPLRQEAERRGLTIPFRPMKAPRGKIEFIRGLQLYGEAGEIEFVQEFPDAKAQFLNFPHPPIDAPNALAYALLMRPGRPIFDELPPECIVEDLEPIAFEPIWLAANARDGWVTAALIQIHQGRLRVLADWCLDGLPEERVEGIAIGARMAVEGLRDAEAPRARGYEALKNPSAAPIFKTIRASPKWLIPGWHYDQWTNVGLCQAVSRIPAKAQRGGSADAGRAFLRDALVRLGGQEPAALVSSAARWTLRALSGGYCRGKSGVDPESGPYRILMEGLECALGLARVAESDESEDDRANWAFDRYGRRYKSAMPLRERPH